MMKTEAEIREMLSYWRWQRDNAEVGVLKTPIETVIAVIKEVLGD